MNNRPSHKIARSLVAYGVLESYSKKRGICNPSDKYVTTCPFIWRDKVLITKYVDGCFFPYLLELEYTKLRYTGEKGKWKCTINGEDIMVSSRIEERAINKIIDSKEIT